MIVIVVQSSLGIVFEDKELVEFNVLNRCLRVLLLFCRENLEHKAHYLNGIAVRAL